MNRSFVRFTTIAALAGLTIIAAKAFPLPQQYSVQNFQGGPITFSAGGPNHLAVLASMLGLTANQQEQAKAVLDEEEAASRPLLEQLKQASESLVSAQKAGAPDGEIDQLARNMADISGDILALDAKAQSRIYGQLSAEQKQKVEQFPHPFFPPSAPLLPLGPVSFSFSGGHKQN
jgi:Spy/CpxP family protein refolding chaperone